MNSFRIRLQLRFLRNQIHLYETFEDSIRKKQTAEGWEKGLKTVRFRIGCSKRNGSEEGLPT